MTPHEMGFTLVSPPRRFSSSRIACLGALLVVLSFPTTVLGVTLSQLILKRTDTADPVKSEHVDEWITQAEKGDWKLRTEFAAAYLFKDDCQKLKYGHRCQAMAARPEVARKFLFQIIDTPGDSKEISREVPEKPSQRLHLFDLQALQKNFALNRLGEAVRRSSTGKPDLNDPACKDYIKYETLAAESGDVCAAQGIYRAYATTTCTEEDAAKEVYFGKLGAGCPVQ